MKHACCSQCGVAMKSDIPSFDLTTWRQISALDEESTPTPPCLAYDSIASPHYHWSYCSTLRDLYASQEYAMQVDVGPVQTVRKTPVVSKYILNTRSAIICSNKK